MVADKVFNLQVSSQLVYQSDIPIKGKTFVKVFIDKVGEGTWEVVDSNDYQLINDSLVFTERPTGFLLIMQVATTPSELQQTPTDVSLLLTIREEIKTLASSLGDLVVVSESADKVVIVSNNIDNVNTVALSINSVITTATNIDKVIVVADNIVHVANVDSILAEVVNVSDNSLAVVSVSNNMASVISVKDNLGDIQLLSANMTDINSVVDQIIPNLSEILQADTNAQIATTKASEASTSASNALASENKAKKWADEDEDVPVEFGKFSAKHWASKAEGFVADGLIDDLTPLTDKTYSSSKVQSLHDLQAQSIANLATAQGEFVGTGLPIFSLTTTEQTLPFTVVIPSTDSSVFEFNDLANTCTFKINASFNFRTVLELQLTTNATRTITVTGRNSADNSVVYTRTASVSGNNGDIFQINSNQLLTVSKNGVPVAPLTIYFTFKADGAGVTLRTLSSQFTSSSSYSLETDRAPILNPKFTDSITFGVDKSNWSSFKVAEFPNGFFYGSDGIDLYSGVNAYYDGSWKRKIADKSALHLVSKGSHKFKVAPTGIIDSTITWTDVASIDDTGFLVVNGSNNLPAFSFIGDPDTGMYRVSANALGFVTAGVNRWTFNSFGDVGFGVTADSWHSTARALQMPAGGLFSVNATNQSLIQNAYLGVGGNYYYKTSAPSSMYSQEGGEHIFRHAPSGTAGASITFSEIFRMSSDGVVSISGAPVSRLVHSASVATTSGTVKDFVGIPSWAKRVKIILNGIRLSASAHLLVQIGNTTFTTTGYASVSAYAGGANNANYVASTIGFVVSSGSSSNTLCGQLDISLESSGNYVCSHVATPLTNVSLFGAGKLELGSPLDRVRITSTTGTDTFTAGSISLVWEG